MLRRIVEIIKVNTECSNEISENSLLCDLEMTSIDFVKIVIEIETEFNIEFEDEKLQFSEFSTVQSLIDYVKKGWRVNEC